MKQKLVNPVHQLLRRHKWHLFLERHEHQIREFQRMNGKNAELPVIWSPALNDYTWVSRQHRRKIGWEPKKVREEYKGIGSWFKAIFQKIFRLQKQEPG